MGNSMRKFSFGLWYRAEHSKVDNASVDTPDQSSQRQTSEHVSYGGELSAGIESLALNDNSATSGRTSRQRVEIDRPAMVHSVEDSKGSNTIAMPVNKDSSTPQKSSENYEEAKSTGEQDNVASTSSNDCSINDERETNRSASSGSDREYWEKLIERLIPEGEWKGLNVIILNTEEDNDVADELAQNLREKFGCRIPCDLYNSLYRLHGGQAMTELQKWADVVLILVSHSWKQAVSNVHPTHESDSETTKYRYIIMQKNFIKDTCINHKVISVFKPGTKKDVVSDIPEIPNPYTLEYITNNFQDVASSFVKLSKVAKELISKSGQTSSSDSHPSNGDSEGQNPASN